MIDFVLTVHGAALAAAVVVLHRYADKSDFVSAMNKNTTETVERIRFRLIEQLRAFLRPVFKNTEIARIREVVDDRGDPWKTETGDPEKTESFRNAISGFIDTEKGAVADYHGLRTLHARWMLCTTCISWLAWITTLWQIIAFAGIGASQKIFAVVPSLIWIAISLTPTVLFAVLYFVAIGFLMASNDSIMKIVRHYG